MPRGNDLIGLPVLVGPKLTVAGRVQEVLLSADGAQICGLVLEAGSWFSPRRVLDFQAVRLVSETQILADEVYLPAEAQVRGCQALHGLPVLRHTGEEVGFLDDLHFEAGTGRLTALQVSRGFVEDLLSGKEIVTVNGPVQTGEGAIVLDGPGELSGGALS